MIFTARCYVGSISQHSAPGWGAWHGVETAYSSECEICFVTEMPFEILNHCTWLWGEPFPVSTFHTRLNVNSSVNPCL